MDLEKALQLFEDLEYSDDIQNFIAQANSRYILFNVNEPKDNFPRFTPNLDERLSSIAYTYLSVGCTFAENGKIDDAVIAFEKGASILEYIHVPDQNKTEESQYFQLISALAYYAAFQYSKSYIVLKGSKYTTKTSALVSAFLKKDFSKLLELVNEILLGKEYSDERINLIKDELEAQYRIYTFILAKSFAYLIEYTFSGNSEWLQQSKETLKDLLELTSIDNEPAIWWIIRLLKYIIDGFAESSVWPVLHKHLGKENNYLLNEYIKSLAFGTPTITELFISQRNALDKVLSDEGAVVSLPTSSGKTRIAEITILQKLIEYEDSLILYLAPFRSLAFEIEEDLSDTFEPIGFQVSHLYGGGQFNKIDKTLIENSRIIVATPEKAKAILRSDDDIKDKIQLAVIDEGHLLGTTQREITNEIFIEELKLLIEKNSGKLILLSAVLPNTKEFSEWITPNSNQVVESNWRPSSQRLGVLEWTGRNVNIKWKSNDEPSPFNNNFIEPFEIERPRSTRIFPNNKKEAIASAALKLTTLGSVLIYVGRKNMVETQAKEVLTALGGEEAQTHGWTNKNDFKVFALACNEAFGDNSEILKYAKYGIICHSAGLPLEVRSTMERLMREGNPKIIIATSTLAQGVNIGVSSVIFANVHITSKPIDSTDFWNIAGRAGRAFVDSEGKILYAIDLTKSQSKINYHRNLAKDYFDLDDIEAAQSGLFLLVKAIYMIAEDCGINEETLLELIAENNLSGFIDNEGNNYSKDIQEHFDWIDDALLSLNVEFESYNMKDVSAWVDDYFRGSLAYIQAVNDSAFNEEKVLSFFRARNKGVIKLAGDPTNWKSYVASGIPLRSSIIVEEHLQEIFEILEEYQNSDQTKEDLVSFLKKTESITEKFPSEHFDNEYSKEELNYVRDLWIKGKPMNDIRKNTDNGFKICTDYFAFTLPWAINAIAKKLDDMDYSDKSEEYSDLAMLVELGLPSFQAAKIYLSGVKSRVAATELASILSFPRDLSVTNLNDYLVTNLDKLKSRCTDLTSRWLDMLKNKDSNKVKEAITTFGIEYPKIENEDKLFLRQYEENYYLCNTDFSYVDSVSIEDDDFKKIANNLSVYFKYDEFFDSWELKVRNPHVDVIQQ